MKFLTSLWESNVEILKVGAAWMGFVLFCMANDQLRWRREKRDELKKASGESSAPPAGRRFVAFLFGNKAQDCVDALRRRMVHYRDRFAKWLR